MPTPAQALLDYPDRWAVPHTREGVQLADVSDALGADFILHDAGEFPVDEKWNYRDVRSPFWRLYHNTRPGASISIGGRSYALTPDLLWLVPAGVTFSCVGVLGPRHFWLHFSPGVTLAHDWIQPRAVTMSPPLRALLGTIRRTLHQTTPAPAPTCIRHLGLALLHTTFSACGPDAVRTLEPRLRAVLLAIERSLADPPANAALAALAQLGTSGFSRWFKTGMGETPAAYVRRRRIAEGSRRLAFTDASVDQVAEALGFANRFHFGRVFKQVLGETPGAYKRRRGPR